MKYNYKKADAALGSSIDNKWIRIKGIEFCIQLSIHYLLKEITPGKIPAEMEVVETNDPIPPNFGVNNNSW